jgi:chromosome segregation ATPase
MSLTEEIYQELWDVLEKGGDLQQVIAKYSSSKGPLYNAIGRFFTEVGPKLNTLKEEMIRVQSDLDQTRLMLDSLNQQIEEAKSNNASLEERGKVLIGQNEALEIKIADKSELVKQLVELGKLGFSSENLDQLCEVLREIAAKHNLKRTEVISKFFDDLKHFDVILGAEAYLNGLQTQIETKKLEAENWQAKEEALRRKYDNLKEAIAAIHALRSRGIKVGQISTWHKILTQFATPEQFEQSLTQYGDMRRLLNVTAEEIEKCDLRLTNMQSHVKTLEKDRARIEGEIDALKTAALEEIKATNNDIEKQRKTLAKDVIQEIRSVGEEARAEIKDYVIRFENSFQKAFEAGRECERTNQKLQKYEGVRNVLESHAAASEGGKDVPK